MFYFVVSTSQALASGYSRTIKSEEQLLNELKVEKEETLNDVYKQLQDQNKLEHFNIYQDIVDERFEIVESNIRGLESSSGYYAANGITK